MAVQKSYSLPSFMNSDSSLPWLLPLITMLIVFAIIPFFYNIYLSFHEFVPAKRALLFVGWDNWIRLFTDGVFWGSLKVSLYYTFMCLLIQLVLGMGIALLIDSDDPGFGIIRSILTLTLVIPPAIAGMIFLIMEDANYGLIPWLLKSVGLIGPEDTILADPTLALWGVMIVDIWQWTPFMVLILVAGLRSSQSYCCSNFDKRNRSMEDGRLCICFNIRWARYSHLHFKFIFVAKVYFCSMGLRSND